MKMKPVFPADSEAQTLNAALRPLDFLIGEWRTTGMHPLVPGETLRGQTTFARHEGGAFLIMRSEVDHPLFPSGTAIIGSDNASGKFMMIYFDERGISRMYEVTIGDRSVTWCRNDPDLSQSLTITARDDGELISRGRMSHKGGDWADDLSQVFSRIR
jgi:hypothetical protein